MAGSRYIPIQLKDHLQQDATTTTILVRVDPADDRYPSYGVTMLDREVQYLGMTYRASIGMVPPSLLGQANLEAGADTTEHLLPEFDIPELNEDAIRAGAYDFATYSIYLVNYEDLSQGHVTLQHGTIGQVTIKSDGLSFVNELRGLSAALKQSVCEKDSLTCRAIFGSQPIGSSLPGQQVRWGWCGFDVTDILVQSVVATVGIEPTLTFTVPESMVAGELAPGVAKFITGRNAGRTIEIADNNAAGQITLAHESTFPIEVGDEVEYRPDCTKVARDDAKGCKFWFESEWVNHFRGEPDIPIGDEAAMVTPSSGWTGTVDDEFVESQIE